MGLLISAKLLVKPKPKPRSRFYNSRAYLPSDYRKWEDCVSSKLLGLVIAPIDFNVRLSIVVADKTIPRGDVDNYAKAIMDCMQKAKIFKNDRFVSHLEVTKRASLPNEPESFIEISIHNV